MQGRLRMGVRGGGTPGGTHGHRGRAKVRRGGGARGGDVWQNQPELYRLKYASPRRRATSYFKLYNTIGLSGNVPINHRTQDPTRYLTRR
jgi:hypothetical protein